MNMKNPVDLDQLFQIAIIVEDIEKSAKEWAEILGVPVPEIKVLPKPGAPTDDVVYRGEMTSYLLKLALIYAPNGFMIELHQCDENNSTFREYVDKHGYGVHHLGFMMGDKRDAVIEELGQRGYEMRTVAKDHSWTIVDSEDVLGVNLNIKPHT